MQLQYGLDADLNIAEITFLKKNRGIKITNMYDNDSQKEGGSILVFRGCLFPGVYRSVYY